MKSITKNVSIGASPVCELLSALFLVQSYEKLLPTNPRHELYFPVELHKWVETIRRSMTNELKQSLEIFFNYESYLGLSLFQFIWNTQTYHSLSDFIQMLDKLPAKELLREFLNTGYNQTSPDIYDSESVTEFIKQKSLPEVEKWKLLYLYADAEHTKKNFTQLLTEFQQHYLPEEELSSLVELQNQHIRDLEEKWKQHPKETLDKLLSNHYTMVEGKGKTILFPTYHGGTHSSSSYNTKSETFIYIYGIGYSEIALNQAMNEDRMVEAIKALSDETRIKIIKILNSTPCYGYELAKTLQLSNSTISHHLSQLSSLGIITATKEDNKNYYQVNKELINSIMEKMAHFLTN